MRSLKCIVLALGLCSAWFVTGCETSHTETDKPNLLGGHTHEETTTTKNPVTGDTSTTHTEEKTR